MSNSDNEAWAWELFVQKQVARQYSEPNYTGKRPLDFSPFAEALTTRSESRTAEIQRLLEGSTIVDIRAMFAGGQLSAAELVLFYIGRIQRYDHEKLNSFLALNPEALQIAQQRDAERAAGQVHGPLHGIPVLLKDNIATADQMHTTAGAAAMATAQSDRDAFIVQQLRAAGAVILGKGNLSEWANFMTLESANGFSVLGGQTRNVYGQFDAGGSSSGSAVAVAAHLVTVSVGSETAGSIVYPASQNAVVGLKPSIGAVSRDRIVPITAAMDTAGPLGRTVTDVALLYNVLAAYDPNDPLAAGAQSLADVDFTQYLRADGLQGKRVGVVLAEKFFRPGDDQIVAQAIERLKAAGAEVVMVTDFARPEIDYLPVLHYGMHHDLNHYLAAVAPHAPVRSLGEVVAFNAADLANRAPFGQDLLEKSLAAELTAEAHVALVESNRASGRAAITQLLAAHHLDVILSVSNHLTGVYAPAGNPAVTVPAGFRESGEPLGITFVGEYLADGLLLQYAYAFEQAGE